MPAMYVNPGIIGLANDILWCALIIRNEIFFSISVIDGTAPIDQNNNETHLAKNKQCQVQISLAQKKIAI